MSCVAEAKAVTRAAAPQGRQSALRTDDRHGDQRRTDQKLGQQHPAAPPAEPAEDRDVEPVHDRSPDEFEGIGQTDPGDEADGRQGHVALAQPETERRACQQEGQARAETQQQGDQDATPTQRLDYVLRARPARRGLRGAVGHLWRPSKRRPRVPIRRRPWRGPCGSSSGRVRRAGNRAPAASPDDRSSPRRGRPCGPRQRRWRSGPRSASGRRRRG